MITGKQIVESCKKRLGWGYVLGAQGELYSPEAAKRFYDTFKEKPLSYYANMCSKWFGSYVVDCSGLIIEAFRDHTPHADQTANTLYSECTEKGDIASIPEIPGLCIWKKGHIGVYIGRGKVIEARGAAYGVVETELNNRPWVKWGKLEGVTYETAAKADSSCFTLSRILKKKVFMLRGDDVVAVQKRLNGLGYQCERADGVFGNKTKAAVIAFQTAKGLTADGIVGKNTCVALGGKWNI